MTVKTTGIEFKRFYSDKTFWPEDVWHEHDCITVDGEEQKDGVDPEQLKDSAEVCIRDVIVFGPQWDGNEPSLETYFKRWKKQQTATVIMVECDKEVLAAVKAAIKAAGGRVI